MKLLSALLFILVLTAVCNGFCEEHVSESQDEGSAVPDFSNKEFSQSISTPPHDGNTVSGGYPKITAIFADPRRHSGQFLSGRYDANEIYSFRRNVSLDAVIVPTRVSSGDESEEYAETYRILVEAADDLGDYGYHEDVGVGYFNGTARTGSAISVPIVSLRDPEQSLVAAPTRNGSVLRYVVYVQYGSMRMAYYPEFSNRSLDFLDVFSNQPSPYGVVVGLEYSHP